MKHSEFVTRIKEAQSSTTATIPLSHKKLNGVVSIGRGCGILFGGMSGSGKTAIVDSIFLLGIYDTWLDQKVKTFNPSWLYFSLERPLYYKYAKWVCHKLWQTYRILIDVPTLLNWNNRMYRMSDELIQLISTLDEYFEGLFEKATIINGSHTPMTISRIVTNHMVQFGNIRQINENLKTFDYNNNEDIVISVVDHIGKLKVTQAYPTDKLTVDAYSAFMSNIFRDIYMGLYIDVSQLNRALTSTDRLKQNDIDIKHSDFLTSSETYSNCDICFGMLNPLKQGVETYPSDNGYQMSKVVDIEGKNRFRSLKILKNSFGSDDIRIHYRFLGECGAMTELPKASEMNQIVPNTNMTYYDFLTLKGYKIDSKWRKD